MVPGGEVDSWLRWCEKHAEEVDPLTQVRRDVAAFGREPENAPPTSARADGGDEGDA